MGINDFVRTDRALLTNSPLFRLAPPSWTRLEPTHITGDPEPGLEARVHDPLWLLTRQWQFGEFVGENAGAPLSVHLSVTTSPVVRWAPVDRDGVEGTPRDVAAGAMLEPTIERESGLHGPSGADRALAGQAFHALLGDRGLPALAAELLARAPHDGAGLPAVLAGRVADGQALAMALEAAAGLPDWLTPADPAVAGELAAAAAAWLDWYRAEVGPAEIDDEAWVPDRLEYRFRLAARPAGDEVVLDAPEFLGGEVDWWAFDVLPDASLDVAAGTPSTTIATTLWASKLRFAGMPADRLWEFEDGSVNLGALEVQPHDLARLLFAEFAMVTGPDWLIVPVDAPVGSVARVDWVTYTTTFNERFLVRHTSALPDVDEAWRLFTLTGDDPERHLLYVPSAADVSQGEPVEDVRFLRDELANLVWAVERRYQDADGRVLSRDREVQPPLPGAGGNDRVDAADLDYRLASDVPVNWYPYAPMSAGYRVIRLRRAELTGQPGRGPARGRLIPEIDGLVDGEVPREGIQVLRVPAVARHADGTWERWVGRRIVVGRGEGSSGLRYDAAVPRE